MNKLNGERVSFISLIKDYNWSINIPMIQRDFAYGRATQKVSATNFVSTLLDAMTDSNENHLDLNFIYGSTDDNHHFIVIDGQQRLTVLFLLHLYIAHFENKFEAFQKIMLREGQSSFIYQTRTSSSDFTNALITSTDGLHQLITECKTGEELVENIKYSPWFLKSWESDPTVISILSLIETIHEVRIKKDLMNKTFHDDRVTFQILDIKSYKLTDELYIKMNARGKPLSDWQNFKAYLHEFISTKKEDIIVDDWEEALDKDWLDFFWKNSKDKKQVEDNLLNYFIDVLHFEYGTTIKNWDKEKYVFSEIVNSKENGIVNFCKQHNLLSINYINKCFAGLNSLLKIDIEAFEKTTKSVLLPHFSSYNLKDKLFNSKTSLQLYERTYHYCILAGLRLSLSNSVSWENPEMDRWLRVTRNLVFNQIIDSDLRLYNVIKSLDSIEVKNDFNIDKFPLDNLKPGFTDNQIKEELVKRKYITDNDKQSLIYELEDHFYLFGQINFLFEISKDNEVIDFDKVEKYGKKLIGFINDNFKDDQYLLQRALLTKGFYFGKRKRNYTLCLWKQGNVRERNENWRTVFNDSEKRSLLKELLDDDRTLTEIIEKSDGTNWHTYLINEPRIYTYSKEGLIRQISDNNIRILKTTTIGGRQAELKTLSLFYSTFDNQKIDDFHPFTNKGYHIGVGQASLPCIYLDGWHFEDDSNYALDIYTKSEQCFYFRFFNRDGSILESLRDTLSDLDFKIDEEENYLLKVEEEEIETKLKSILKSFNSIIN